MRRRPADLLVGVILNLQLDAATLSTDYHPANETSLQPKLAVLADNDAFRLNPRKVSLEAFNDIDLFLIRDEPFLSLPSDGYARPHLVFDASQSGAKRYC